MGGLATRMLFAVLRSATWVGFLQQVLGIDGLIPDPSNLESSVHVTVSGGLLELHVDHNYNQRMKLHRRVNLFVYLNHEWEESYGGHLELWNRNVTECGARILPSFGRVAGFLSTDYSWHGHPHPL